MAEIELLVSTLCLWYQYEKKENVDRKIGKRLEARSWITPKIDNQALNGNSYHPGSPAFPGH